MSSIETDARELASVDRVELKVAVADGRQREVLEALAVDPLKRALGQVYYFDTERLALLHRGVVLRARRRPGEEGDTAVKLRPVAPDELPRTWRAEPGLTIEADVAPGRVVCSATLKAACPDGVIAATVGGARPLRTLFSKRQRALLRDVGLAETDWAALRVLGPVEVRKVRARPRKLGLGLVVQHWCYPDRASLLELSTRVTPEELPEAAARLAGFLDELDVDISSEQQMKTERTLAFFAAIRSSCGA